jgi:hypothetical protein
MPDHTITLTISGGQITNAVLNPQQVISNDTVTWRFVGNQQPVPEPVDGLRVEFQAFVPADHSTPVAGRGAHPFVMFMSSPGATAGPYTVSPNNRPGLYLYAVINNADGTVVKWTTPLFTVGSFGQFFGGIVKPDGPPTGSPNAQP